MRTNNIYGLLVYGTLKSGESNHGVLESTKASYVADVDIPGYVMFCNHSFPFILPASYAKDSIHAEFWNISDECLRRCDRLEGNPHHYQRTVVEVPQYGRAFMYVYSPDSFKRTLDHLITTIGTVAKSRIDHIPGGEWKPTGVERKAIWVPGQAKHLVNYKYLNGQDKPTGQDTSSVILLPHKKEEPSSSTLVNQDNAAAKEEEYIYVEHDVQAAS